MPDLQIRHHRTGTILYAGRFRTVRDCVEQAVRDGVCLDYADLRNANLAHAALDDATLRRARLDYANLTGANLSEARLSGASFAHATLYGTCLCFSALDSCDFRGAFFGGTDVAGAVLDRGRFSTLSAFSLNFIDAGQLQNCLYHAEDGKGCAFSKPPLVLHGLAQPIVLMEEHILIGHRLLRRAEWAGRNEQAA